MSTQTVPNIVTLGYCTNVHAGVTPDQITANLQRYALPVKARVSPDQPMPIGLWLPASCASALEGDKGDAFTAWLRDHGLRVFTLNAFPYDDFHTDIVKHHVYEPDWVSSERLTHTTRLAAILAHTLEPGDAASISTLPVGWPDDAAGRDEQRLGMAAAQLRVLAEELARIESETGVHITVDLEPEPGCLFSTSKDAVSFFERFLTAEIDRRHLGICHDVCHAAVMFEDQRDVLARYANAGIRVNKVQVSSAIDADVRTLGPGAAIRALRPFAEERYLHQTGWLTGERFELIEDLPQAIARLESARTPTQLRVHFHVPVHLTAVGELGTTHDQIIPAIAAARELHDTRQFEVETYAFDVLPDESRPASLADSIAEELEWVGALLNRS